MPTQTAATAKAEAAAIVEEFGFFDDWEDRYQLLIDQGRKLAPFPGHLRDDSHKLRGCQSVVYFAAERDASDIVTFTAESDAAIVQGLVALLLRVYSGTPCHRNSRYRAEFPNRNWSRFTSFGHPQKRPCQHAWRY